MDTKDNYSNRIEHTVYTLVLGVVVIRAGDRIKWATGLLWPTWLFLYILPWWLLAQVAQELPTRY